MRVHLSDRPFHCPQENCKYKTKRKRYLSAHLNASQVEYVSVSAKEMRPVT